VSHSKSPRTPTPLLLSLVLITAVEMAYIDGVFVDGIEVGESIDDESLRSTIKN